MTDYEQILSLLAAYCHVVDRDSAEEIAKLFWEDASLDFGERVVGTTEITAFYDRWIRESREPVLNLRHLIYAPAIDIEGARARAVCYFDADCISARKHTPILIRGTYSDTLEKRGEFWRFLERKIVTI